MVRGRVEAEERQVLVSDSNMDKYREQGRLLVLYDMNGDSSSTVVSLFTVT